MATLRSLPPEMLDQILNGVSANGLPFLDPLWRFAARAAHPAWRDTIDRAGSATMRTHAKAFRRAWSTPYRDADDGVHECKCTYGQHRDFVAALASGRIVSARCAVDRPWVTRWCAEDNMPPQDRAVIALLSTPPGSIHDASNAHTVAIVRDIVEPHMKSDDASTSLPCRPVNRNFWQHIQRIERCDSDDAWDPCESEFLYDTLGIMQAWDRYDVMLSLLAIYTMRGVIDGVLRHAAFSDHVEVVEAALIHADTLWGDNEPPDPTHKWRRLWKYAVWSGGTRVLDRLLCLCAHPASEQRAKHPDREAALARMARLTRSSGDLSWQKRAARSDNICALVVGQRHGVPIDVCRLLTEASESNNYAIVRWLLTYAAGAHGLFLDNNSALAHACASALAEIIRSADAHDPDCWRLDLCACYSSRRKGAKAPPTTDDKDETESQARVDARLTVDALCDAMLPLMVTEADVQVARHFLNTYLRRQQHAPDGIALTVHVLKRWEGVIAHRIRPRGWNALITAAVAVDAIDALDVILALAASQPPSQLG
nr:hypothetical protein [Pandoravirus massiliensis]